MVFHGTVLYDLNLMTAANTTLDKFKSILARDDMMIVSVAYPQENVLFGDSIIQCEATLLWLKNNASNELGITVNKIFLWALPRRLCGNKTQYNAQNKWCDR